MAAAPAARPLPARAGLGLKPEHVGAILGGAAPALGFWEIHAENYFGAGGPLHGALTRIRERWPLSVHGVGLSIGAETRPDAAHLARLRALIARYEPASFSEHLAWSTQAGIYYNDLLPLPYDEPTLRRVCAHLAEVQDALGRRLLIENPATYLGYACSSMSEPQFVSEVVRRSGCGLLLDVSNVLVSATNHGLDPQAYLDALPLAAVGEIHLAGFTEEHDGSGRRLLIDSHAAPVDEAVWALFAQALTITGAQPTLIERDANIPALPVLLAEAARAEALLAALCCAGAGVPA
ncbi:MAG: DUF692 domain-containing protein [Nevskia sp.]